MRSIGLVAMFQVWNRFRSEVVHVQRNGRLLSILQLLVVQKVSIKLSKKGSKIKSSQNLSDIRKLIRKQLFF